MLYEPDLAQCIRTTFLVTNVLMKAHTASWRKDGAFDVEGETGNCYTMLGQLTLVRPSLGSVISVAVTDTH